MKPESFDVGIVYRPLESSNASYPNNWYTRDWDRKIAKFSHWALVFRSSKRSKSLQVELIPREKRVTYRIKDFTGGQFQVHFFGIYSGDLSGIYKLAEEHSMNGDKYSKSENNCQHWVARLVDKLKPFSITSQTIYDDILCVMGKSKFLDISVVYNVPLSYRKAIGSVVKRRAQAVREVVREAKERVVQKVARRLYPIAFDLVLQRRARQGLGMAWRW
ncbi:hypothetical protein FRC18_004512 [Serendipita sp. 400]|nr:hypothetical protein FRC18_004512 [Serendipita sp. 400]